MAEQQDQSEPRATARKSASWLRRLRVVLLFAGPLVLIAVGAWYYLSHEGLVSTKDAFIRHNTVVISTQVAGRVIAVPVASNDHVNRGDILLKLDPAPFQARLEAAQAHVAAVAMQIKAQQAHYDAVKAQIDSAQTKAAYLDREVNRLAPLAKRNVITHAKLDKARTGLLQARHKVAALQAQQAQIRAQLGGDPQQPLAKNANYQAAQAALKQAELNLSYTTVRAPAAGQLGTVGVLRGDVMAPGKAAMPLVEANEVWVKANFKETGLTHMRRGDPATITVDAYPDRTWHGHVESISPASGAVSSLLPPQNATGNWVKVVQRIPVRIAVEPQADAPPLRAGMSVEVTVNVRDNMDESATSS